MTARCTLIAILAMSAGYLCTSPNSTAADLMSEESLNRLGAQEYWHAELPLPAGETVVRTALLDENLYAITSENHVFAIHAATGIIRWSNLVDDPGQAIRGPSHNDKYAFFTTSGGVRLFDRRTGELAGEPRALNGVVIEAIGDRATISIGQLHGVRRDDVFRVFRKERPNDPDGVTIAQLKITAVDWRQAKGRLTRVDSSLRAQSGDEVQANVVLPLEEVKIKYPPTSTVIADNAYVYVGTTNQRFFSYNILHGHERWRFRTPRTVTSTPVIVGENLYIAGQDGRVISCTAEKKEKNWIFQTKDAVFADLLVNDRYVYVASGDRSLYCLRRETGTQVWRERFNSELTDAPVLVGERLYQRVPAEGLYVMDAETGKTLWHREEGGRCLGEFEGDVYLLTDREPHSLIRADARTGKIEAAACAKLAAFANASATDKSILLTSRDGKMVCLRSQHAPRLRPAQIAEVLRNDQLLRLKEKAIAAATAEKNKPEAAGEAPPRRHWKLLFAEEDWLASRNTAKPAGGYGHVSLESDEPASAEPEVEVIEDDDATTKEEDDGVWTFDEDDEDEDDIAADDDEEDEDEEADEEDDEEDDEDDDDEEE